MIRGVYIEFEKDGRYHDLKLSYNLVLLVLVLRVMHEGKNGVCKVERSREQHQVSHD